jgi:hypothetical protein
MNILDRAVDLAQGRHPDQYLVEVVLEDDAGPISVVLSGGVVTVSLSEVLDDDAGI